MKLTQTLIGVAGFAGAIALYFVFAGLIGLASGLMLTALTSPYGLLALVLFAALAIRG